MHSAVRQIVDTSDLSGILDVHLGGSVSLYTSEVVQGSNVAYKEALLMGDDEDFLRARS